MFAKELNCANEIAAASRESFRHILLAFSSSLLPSPFISSYHRDIASLFRRDTKVSLLAREAASRVGKGTKIQE